MTNQNKNLIQLAYVAHPHGIKGEAELRLTNTNPEEAILQEGMTVVLFPSSLKSKISKAGEEWKISKLRFGNKIICQFEGIQDRTHLESLIPFEVHLDRAEFPENKDGEVYLVDLIGLTAVNEAGEEVGELVNIEDNGMQYLLDIRLKTGGYTLLPYVDVFVKNIDLENKKITVVMPEYTE